MLPGMKEVEDMAASLVSEIRQDKAQFKMLQELLHMRTTFRILICASSC